MFCKNCGKEINDKAIICVNCGVAVTPLTPTVTPDQPANGTNKFNVCALLGFIFSLVGIVVDTSLIFTDFTLLYAFTIAGLILSIIGTVKSKKLQNGKGFGIAGIVISSVSLALLIIILFFAVIFIVLLGLSLGGL